MNYYLYLTIFIFLPGFEGIAPCTCPLGCPRPVSSAEQKKTSYKTKTDLSMEDALISLTEMLK